MNEAPPPNSPGRRYYSNLGLFLQGFSMPDGANGEERSLYAQFVERLDAAGVLVARPPWTAKRGT